MLGSHDRTVVTAPAKDNRTSRYSYDVFGSQLVTSTREFSGESDPGTGEFKVQTQNTYDSFERLLSVRDDQDKDGGADANGEVYCYDAIDRRDRKVFGVAASSGSEDDSSRRGAIDVLWDFEFTFPGLAGDLPVAFSQEIEAEMRSSSAGSRDVTVEPGTAFEVREGARVVGHGRVVEVLAE